MEAPTDGEASAPSPPPASMLLASSLSPTHRAHRSHITLPPLLSRPDPLFTPRHAPDTIVQPHTPSVEPELCAASTTATKPAPDGRLFVFSEPAVSGGLSTARPHSLLSAPTSQTAHNEASASEMNAVSSTQHEHGRASSVSAATASVMSYIRTLTGRLSASVSPRPVSADSLDSRPLTPLSIAHEPAASQPQQHVYDISPSSTARQPITPSTRSASRAASAQPLTHRPSTAVQPPSAHQRIFCALDYDGNGFIGTHDLLRAVRALKGRAAGGGSSERGGGSTSDELLVECMLSMASVDDDDEDADTASGQLSFAEFRGMITRHWPTAVISQ